MNQLVSIVEVFINILIFAIFARSLLTWFPIDHNGPIFQALDAITEPILAPLRKVIPLVGMVDITPMIAVFVLYFLAQALATV